jgi:hypothetical protein
MDHEWGYCDLCRAEIVLCGKCGNNCCNGSYGTLPDGTQCDECPEAYRIQDKGWKFRDRAALSAPLNI